MAKKSHRMTLINNLSGIAEENAQDSVFEDDELDDSALLNSTFKTVSEQAKKLLRSPVIDTSPAVSSSTDIVCTCTCTCTSRDIKAIVDQLVERKLDDLLSDTSSPKNTSVLNKSFILESQRKLSDDIENFDSKYKSFTEKSDKIETALESIEKLKTNFNNLDKKFMAYQTNYDEKLARNLQDEEFQPSSKQAFLEKVEKRMSEVESRVDKCEVQIEDGQQKSRLGTLEFHGMPYEGSKDFPENPYAMVINFARFHLNINISLRDISICHRQVIPSEKKRLGKRYIAPIYCRFLNRSLANAILKKRHWLVNVRNIFNQKFEIKENLTYHRRMLLESIQTELSHLTSWTSNGKVFVQESSDKKPIMIIDDAAVKDLARKHPKKKDTPPYLADRDVEENVMPRTHLYERRHYANVALGRNMHHNDHQRQSLHFSHFPTMPGYATNGNSLGSKHPFYRSFNPNPKVLYFKNKSLSDYRSTIS